MPGFWPSKALVDIFIELKLIFNGSNKNDVQSLDQGQQGSTYTGQGRVIFGGVSETTNQIFSEVCVKENSFSSNILKRILARYKSLNIKTKMFNCSQLAPWHVKMSLNFDAIFLCGQFSSMEFYKGSKDPYSLFWGYTFFWVYDTFDLLFYHNKSHGQIYNEHYFQVIDKKPLLDRRFLKMSVSSNQGTSESAPLLPSSLRRNNSFV